MGEGGGEKEEMKRLFGPVMVLLLTGCATGPWTPPEAADVIHSRQSAAALQDSKAEAATFRADLAAARITAAKQEAELRELRRQISELQQLLDAKQAALIKMRDENERLAQSATIAQVRVADPGAVSTNPDEITVLKARLSDMEAALAALAAELAQVKKEIARPPQPLLLPPGEKARMRAEEKR